jgi:predicted HTH transcriptional regulator
MAESDLSELVSGKSEALDVEYKAWMDTTEPATRAKLAKHIAALANHGGGYLIFGVDDTSRQPMGETPLDRGLFRQAAIAGIVKKYVDPRVRVRVDEAAHAGVLYPVAIVPSQSLAMRKPFRLELGARRVDVTDRQMEPFHAAALNLGGEIRDAQ